MPESSPHEEGCLCEWCRPRTMAQAKVGIVALVDEATGYQEQRGEHDLANLYASLHGPDADPAG